MKKFFTAVILFLAIVFVISRFTELKEVLHVLQDARILVLVAGIGVLMLWFLTMGATFQAIFRMVGVEKSLLDTTRLVAAVNFVNLVAPSAGISGMTVFYSDAQKNSLSPARITVGSVIFLIFDYIGLLSIILIGLVILLIRQDLHVTEIIAFCLFVLLTAVLIGLLGLAARSPAQLSRLLSWFAARINWITRKIIHRDLIRSGKAAAFALELSEGLTALNKSRQGWIQPALFTLLNKIWLITILGLMFLAFDVQVSLAQLIAGFAVGYLFVIISPTPAGVGIVEGVLTLALSNLGIPVEAAAVVTLAFRGITFWLPLLIGFIAFRLLHAPAIELTRT